MGAMIDQCIQNSTSNPRLSHSLTTFFERLLLLPGGRLLDLIFIEEGGQQVSMYDKLVVQTQAALSCFGSMAGSMAGSLLPCFRGCFSLSRLKAPQASWVHCAKS